MAGMLALPLSPLLASPTPMEMLGAVAHNIKDGSSAAAQGCLHLLKGSTWAFSTAAQIFKKVTSHNYVAIPLGTAALATIFLRMKAQPYNKIIDKAEFDFGPLLPDADASLKVRIDTSQLYAWKTDVWPTAHAVKENEELVWEALKQSNFFPRGPLIVQNQCNLTPDQIRQAVRANVLTHIREKIAAEKKELAQHHASLRTCLQAFRLWNITTTGVDEQWAQSNDGAPSMGPTPAQEVEIEGYCNDNWYDIAFSPGKFLKRTILYPQEGRAARLYWQVTQSIVRLDALLALVQARLDLAPNELC